MIGLRVLGSASVLLGVCVCFSACGGGGPPSPGAPVPALTAPPGAREPTAAPGARDPAAPRTYEPFVAASAEGDVVAPFVRPEHSSRLSSPLPKGRLRERWAAALPSSFQPAFILAAGTRIVVEGRASAVAIGGAQSAFVLLDTRGVRVAEDVALGAHLRLEPANGKLYGIGAPDARTAWSLADGARRADTPGEDDPRFVAGPMAIRATQHGTTHVFITATNVEIDARDSGQQRSVVEPPVVPLDASIDDASNLHVIVRQDKDLALWTTPLAAGSVGRVRLGLLRRERADVPPILGKTLRVIVLDDRMIALARDGKTAWERKGALTGGATLTADDQLLVASDAKLVVVDDAGRASELVTAPREIFVTPPILTSGGLLLAATGNALHAYGFE